MARRNDAKTSTKKRAARASKEPPVSAFVKMTTLDAPYAGVMVPHMLDEARFPFAERIALVDRRERYLGKYTDRPRATREDLDRVLATMLEKRQIDRVIEVDPARSVRAPIMERYFGEDARRISPYASTGGPIYPTLFGLEQVANHRVVQFDCDMFFYTGGHSWVRAGLDLMKRDKTLWLMMSHPGPPAGPIGVNRSLGAWNAPLARFDQKLRIWRFKNATTRYFLTDRRYLYGKLRFTGDQERCAPLEDCISDALMRHGAYRGALSGATGWHLHAFDHAAPFPEWAPALVNAVVAGRIPPTQRGSFDIALHRKVERDAWRAVIAGDPTFVPYA